MKDLLNKLDPKNIFLFDGMGALLSFILTGLILPNFSEELGIPIHVLLALAAIPLVIGGFSLSIYKFVRQVKPWMLKVVMFTNIEYCLVSMLLILVFDGITLIGKAILIYEIIVIFIVVAIEYRIYRQMNQSFESHSS